MVWAINSKAVDECFEAVARVLDELDTATDDNRIEIELEQRRFALA